MRQAIGVLVVSLLIGTVVLVGNPNVGKSVLFNALTGSYVTVSNYPGTSVEVSRGTTVIEGIEPFVFVPFDSFLYAVDLLGYSFMSVATLFAANVFPGPGIERKHVSNRRRSTEPTGYRNSWTRSGVSVSSTRSCAASRYST